MNLKLFFANRGYSLIDDVCFLCKNSAFHAMMASGDSNPVSDSLSLEDQILVALRRITRAIDLRSRTLLQDYGLTAPQIAVLRAIQRFGPTSAGRLAREVHLGQPTVTGVLNRLEARGLLDRVRSDRDRRSVQVSLTAEGEAVLANAPSPLQEQFQHELAKLKEWEQTQILSTLQRIAEMMDAGSIEAAPVLTSGEDDPALEEAAADPLGEIPAASAGIAPGTVENSAAQHLRDVANAAIDSQEAPPTTTGAAMNDAQCDKTSLSE